MAINTDYRNMAPRPLVFNRTNPMSVPAGSEQKSAPVATKPLTRREQIVATKTAAGEAAKAKQAASAGVYNSTMGKTTFERTTHGVNEKTLDATGLTDVQKSMVASDLKAGPVLPNTVQGIDAGEAAVTALIGKTLAKASPELNAAIDSASSELASIYRDMSAQRKAANSKPATGALNYRTAFQKSVAPKLNLESRLAEVDQKLADACINSSYNCRNMSASLFLLVMQGLRDANEFRLEELQIRDLTDKLKLHAKDLMIAKLQMNFAAEEQKAFGDALNTTAMAGLNINTGLMTGDSRTELNKDLGKSEFSDRLEKENDAIYTKARNGMVKEGSTFESWQKEMKDYKKSLPIMPATAHGATADMMRNIEKEYKKKFPNGIENATPEQKQAAWAELVAEKTGHLDSKAIVKEQFKDLPITDPVAPELPTDATEEERAASEAQFNEFKEAIDKAKDGDMSKAHEWLKKTVVKPDLKGLTKEEQKAAMKEYSVKQQKAYADLNLALGNERTKYIMENDPDVAFGARAGIFKIISGKDIKEVDIPAQPAVGGTLVDDQNKANAGNSSLSAAVFLAQNIPNSMEKVNEALGELQQAGQVGTDVVSMVSTTTQQHRDNVSKANQQIARMFAAMKMIYT